MDDERPLEDSVLGQLVRASRDRTCLDFVRPEDEDLWAYVTGKAAEEKQRLVCAALAASPEYRREVMDLLHGLEDMESQEAEGDFARATAPPAPRLGDFLGEDARHAPSTDKTRTGVHQNTWMRITERLWRLVRMPAFAYGFMLLLMAYPTYRWLGGGASGSLVIASQAVYVRAWTDGELRGGDEGIEIPELILEPTTRIVEVTVWVPASLAKEAGYALARVSLSDQRGRRWREEHPPSLVSIEGRSAFHFTLDRANIEPGLISIRIEREERGTTDARVLAEAQFRIRENP